MSAANGWSSAEKPDELMAALRNSHSLETARLQGKLVGIANAISDGNLDVKILERREDDSTHFITMTSWESLEAIKAFAGDDAEKAMYYPEDDGFLLEFEPAVVHYEVVGRS